MAGRPRSSWMAALTSRAAVRPAAPGPRIVASAHHAADTVCHKSRLSTFERANTSELLDAERVLSTSLLGEVTSDI